MSGAALRMAGSVELLRLNLSLKPVRTNSRRSHVAAATKLPYGQGDTSPRKSLQTHATNSAVNAAAMVESDLMLSTLPSMDSDLEEFQFLESMQLQLEKTFNKSQVDADQTLEDMDALLLGLEGLDAELESALEVVRGDFSEVTVRFKFLKSLLGLNKLLSLFFNVKFAQAYQQCVLTSLLNFNLSSHSLRTPTDWKRSASCRWPK